MPTKNVIQTRMQNKKGSQGFSLLEVLIALFVLSIGLLGLAALQTTSYKFNHQSFLRTQATVQTYDIIDRIRSNSTGNYALTATGTAPTAPTDCLTSTCTANDMALFDLNQWVNFINVYLPQGQGAVSVTTSRYVVTITWVESGITKTQTIETEI